MFLNIYTKNKCKDENKSDIAKQNKKIDKLDNDNKIIAQEKNYHQV